MCSTCRVYMCINADMCDRETFEATENGRNDVHDMHHLCNDQLLRDRSSCFRPALSRCQDIISSNVSPVLLFPFLFASRGRRSRGSIARRLKARVVDRDRHRQMHHRKRPVRHVLRSYGRALLLSGCSWFLRGTDEVADVAV